MQRLIEPLRFEHDAAMPQLYALGTLHDFHALRFPKQYLDNDRVLGIAPDNDLLSALSHYDPGEPFEKPELGLLQGGLHPSVIAGEIRVSARPVLDFMTRWQPRQSVAKAMIDYCQQQRHRYYHKGNNPLVGDLGQPLMARQILPPIDILQAMHDSWNERNIRRCYPLEKFIGEVLAETLTST